MLYVVQPAPFPMISHEITPDISDVKQRALHGLTTEFEHRLGLGHKVTE
jgi:hypothetical protein